MVKTVKISARLLRLSRRMQLSKSSEFFGKSKEALNSFFFFKRFLRVNLTEYFRWQMDGVRSFFEKKDKGV